MYSCMYMYDHGTNFGNKLRKLTKVPGFVHTLTRSQKFAQAKLSVLITIRIGSYVLFFQDKNDCVRVSSFQPINSFVDETKYFFAEVTPLAYVWDSQCKRP